MFEGLKRKSFGEKLLYITVSSIFMIVALTYIYILVWTFISGCKTHTEIVMNPFSLPEQWNFKHYIEVFEKFKVGNSGFITMLFNSLWFAGVGSLLTQFCTATFAYCISQYVFPGSKKIHAVLVILLVLPIFGSGGAAYKLYYNMGLIDNYAQVITAYGVLNVYSLYYIAYFQNFSKAYAEAARVDGANDFQIYFKIALPQAKPMFLAMYLTQFIRDWNSYESALVYLPKKPTLPVGIYQFNTEMIYNLRLDILFAACIIIVLPALILFLVFNKTILSSVTTGGLKG